MHTPWGKADHTERIADGITWVDTPSHGGFKLSRERKAKMPEPYRSIDTFVSRSYGRAGYEDVTQQWYEEDCDWALVVLSWPELFCQNEREIAGRVFQKWHAPKLENVGQ